MKSDARLLLNKKKWKNTSGNRIQETWINRDYRSNNTDARKILNFKRSQKPKNPVFGSYMKTKTATAFIASQIRKEISPSTKTEQKQVQLSKDGNLIITSKSKNASQNIARRGVLQNTGVVQPARTRFLQDRTKYEASTSGMDDLEHTALEDLMDLDTLPSEFVAPRTLPSAANLSRSRMLEKNTMIADSIDQGVSTVAKVYVSNLHPSVSGIDLMELFGDVGIIKNYEMLMPGTAIINFLLPEDAQKACEIYHNRLLDGLPMKCYLQTQKSQPQRSAIAQRLGERIPESTSPVQRVTPAAITVNPRSRINPRNVQFTVKLT